MAMTTAGSKLQTATGITYSPNDSRPQIVYQHTEPLRNIYFSNISWYNFVSSDVLSSKQLNFNIKSSMINISFDSNQKYEI